MASPGKAPTNSSKMRRTSPMQLDPILSQQSDEVTFLDYATEDLEQLMASDLSPLSAFGGAGDRDGLGGPNHATFNYSTGQPAATTPAFSYPTAVSSARAGYAPMNVVPYDTSSRPYADSTTTPAYPARPTISPSPTYYRTAIDWQRSPASDSLYASGEDSSAVSGSSVTNPFGYVTQSGGSDSYMGDYMSPTGSQEASVPSPNVYWSGDSVMSTIDPSFTDASANLATRPYPVYGLPSRTPDRGFSDSEGRVMMEGAADDTGNPPQRKRTKKSPERNVPIPTSALSGYGKPLLAPAPPPGSGSSITSTAATTGHKSKLRSASRTSKNIVPRPSESAEERKTRNSHNMVEKQYRNRLNAQFESLLNALPDSVKSPAGTSGSGGESDGPAGAGVDLGERRLSKAEVLDMSRRYIQSLESQRDKLEQEREGLQEVISTLRSASAQGRQEEGGGG